MLEQTDKHLLEDYFGDFGPILLLILILIPIMLLMLVRIRIRTRILIPILILILLLNQIDKHLLEDYFGDFGPILHIDIPDPFKGSCDIYYAAEVR